MLRRARKTVDYSQPDRTGDTYADNYNDLRGLYLKYKLETSLPCWNRTEEDMTEMARILRVLAQG